MEGTKRRADQVTSSTGALDVPLVCQPCESVLARKLGHLPGLTVRCPVHAFYLLDINHYR